MRVVTVSSHSIDSTRSYLGGTFDKPGLQKSVVVCVASVVVSQGSHRAVHRPS